MPFKEGNELGKGRPKGSKNKNNILDLIKEEYPNYNPILALVEMAHDETEITRNGIKVKAVDDSVKLLCHKEVAKYCYPTLKAIELTGEDGQELIPTLSDAELIAGVNRLLSYTKKG